MDLPTLTQTEAYRTGVRVFKTKRGCKECGGTVFYRPQERQIMTLCMECYPDIDHTSLTKISAAESAHNKKAKKTWNSTFCIPRVFGGMNTK